MEKILEFLDNDTIRLISIFLFPIFALIGARSFLSLLTSNHTRTLKKEKSTVNPSTEDENTNGKPIKKKLSILEMDKKKFLFLEEKLEDVMSIYSPIAIINPVMVKMIIQNGGALLFYGTSTDDMMINKGGGAVIYGTVVGNVTNNGGELHVYGKIIGVLSTANSGKTEIYPTAQVLSH